jgi:hypothetical protein
MCEMKKEKYMVLTMDRPKPNSTRHMNSKYLWYFLHYENRLDMRKHTEGLKMHVGL